MNEPNMPNDPNDRYASKKDADNARSRAASERARDIGPLRPIEDQERRDRGRDSLRVFCETYFQAKFFLGWSPDHLVVIDRLERCVRAGGLFALAMPRGNGKSELAKRACEWAVLYGHRRFVMLIGATESDAENLMQDIKASFATNDLLDRDFPEACQPVRALENITHRAKGQLLDSEPTLLVWKQREIRLAQLPDSVCSGAAIRTAGLTGSVRGASASAADGGTMRPDLVILDDPQTRESAGSPTQTADRERIIRGDVLGLAGPTKTIACVMPCTVIYPGDLADRFLDRDKNAQWQGQRTQLVRSFPTNTPLWDAYFQLRDDSLRAGGDGSEATEFYFQHRDEMDAGGEVSWPERFDEEKYLSALEEAMVRRHENPEEFAAEFQNAPLPPEGSDTSGAIDPEEVAAKVTNLTRGVVPRSCTRVTAYIDVGAHLLWAVVVAWDERFGGSVIDYQVYPEQPASYFSANAPRPGLCDLTTSRGQSQDAIIYSGLGALANSVLGRTYRQEETGSEYRVGQCLIDANWGPTTDLVYEFVRRSAYASTLIASHGKYIGVSSSPMHTWQVRPGERVGSGWRLTPGGSSRGRHVLIDTNHWKTFVASRLRTEPGAAGCLFLHAAGLGGHRLFADHLAAEYPVAVSRPGGRSVEEWKARPGRDNHWFDCLVGAAVAASVQGLNWSAAVATGENVAGKPAKKKLKLSEIFAEKHGTRRR